MRLPGRGACSRTGTRGKQEVLIHDELITDPETGKTDCEQADELMDDTPSAQVDHEGGWSAFRTLWKLRFPARGA